MPAKKRKKQQKKQSKYKVSVLLTSFAFVIVASFLGSLFTTQSVDSSWYQQIKPAITPPNLVFPIVWTIIFGLIAISMFLGLSNSKPKDKGKILGIFAINLMLNVLWSFLFFGLQDVTMAFICLITLWFSILLMIARLLRVSRPAAYLLIPYLLWVTFAGILNYLAMIKLM
jgi:tryptophan-rich sensory protein